MRGLLSVLGQPGALGTQPRGEVFVTGHRGGLLGLGRGLRAQRMRLAGKRVIDVGEEDVCRRRADRKAALGGPGRRAGRQVRDQRAQSAQRERARPQVPEGDAVEALKIGLYGGVVLGKDPGERD
ncbi:hypothetical protein [Micromonospora sp. KC213]|uniref:hypothetical protein n=1 Tax=Micromonospora sp. KC213 TaxID=2530378 RepID=UPI00104461CB|nr:hypothetical protein [Micromonospora sp. KC213]TDC33461.1 hypothetical protein E1166_25670 [Micromonospora sp. KC213]